VVRFVVAGIAVVAISAVSIAAITAWDLSNTLASHSVHLLNGKGSRVVPAIGSLNGPFNLLLVGTDTRTGQGSGYGPLIDSQGVGQNDVTMLLHVSKNHDRATVVSFPRDMFVAVPSCPRPGGGFSPAAARTKINTTLVDGGLSCTVLTVEQLTGVTIPYAAEVTFDGVIAMSDAVGGVPVCVSGTINDSHTHLHLTSGEHTLVGKQALQFLRTRHGVGDGSDLGRISNQQVFLSSMIRTVMASGTLTDLSKVYGLAKAAAQNMRLSDSLNISTLASMALALRHVDLGRVTFVQYPTAAVFGGVVPSQPAGSLLSRAIKLDEPITLTGGTGAPRVGSVLGGGGPRKSGSGAATSSPPTGPAIPVRTPSATGGPSSASATPAPSVTLPKVVHGQTANERTCSRACDV
jgi:LCP family protein required for cell wall assembly